MLTNVDSRRVWLRRFAFVISVVLMACYLLYFFAFLADFNRLLQKWNELGISFSEVKLGLHVLFSPGLQPALAALLLVRMSNESDHALKLAILASVWMVIHLALAFIMISTFELWVVVQFLELLLLYKVYWVRLASNRRVQ